MNSEDDSRSIIPLPDASLAIAGPEGGRKLSEMNADLLALARGPIHKIGEYEWCEPDYRQILLWAEQLALEPEEVIRRTLDRRNLTLFYSEKAGAWEESNSQIYEETVFRDGRIFRLNWDFDLLPVSVFSWVEGLALEELRFAASRAQVQAPPKLALTLTSLRQLHCAGLSLEELDLSGVQSLQLLRCWGNRLATIDLSKVRLLEHLNCHRNELHTLDVSRLAELKELDCSKNRLRKLDLSDNEELESLDCSNNLLVRLNFSDFGPLDFHDSDALFDSWVYVQKDGVGNGGLGLFPPEVFDRLRRDGTQPEASFSDWEAYLNHHGYTSRPREPRP